MKISEYTELLRLADALTYLSENELLSSILKEDGYVPSSFNFDIIIRSVAKRIYSNLTE